MHSYLSVSNIVSILISVDPRRKILMTGSVPTENLPTNSNEIPKAERRILVTHDIEPSTYQEETTSSYMSTIEELIVDKQIKTLVLHADPGGRN